jgi:RNA polymerase sigma factor (sigma-70 family)
VEHPNTSGQRHGGGEEFGTLLEPLLEPAFRLALGMLDDRHHAEDAVQDATIRAWQKLPTLRHTEALRPWFLAIVANQCRMARRAHRWSWAGLARSSGQADQVAAPNLDGLDLRRALRRLDHDRRLAVVLRYYLDLPVDEVAAAMRVPVGTVKSRLHRALRDLQAGLSDWEG